MLKHDIRILPCWLVWSQSPVFSGTQRLRKDKPTSKTCVSWKTNPRRVTPVLSSFSKPFCRDICSLSKTTYFALDQRQILSHFGTFLLEQTLLRVHFTNIDAKSLENGQVKNILYISVYTVPNTFLTTPKVPERFTKHVLNKQTLFWTHTSLFPRSFNYTQWFWLAQKVRATTEVYTSVQTTSSPSYSFSDENKTCHGTLGSTWARWSVFVLCAVTECVTVSTE